ncbi:MAG: hypothetical protein ABW019_08525 [Chitinophagaceae bacterium]
MTDKKAQQTNTGKPAGNNEKPDNSGDKHNAGKEVNKDRSQGKKDLEVKNEVTGANLDGQTI